jgi:hypothetical protein
MPAPVQVHDEQRLLSFDLPRVRALLLHARDNGSRVVAKRHTESNEFVRTDSISAMPTMCGPFSLSGGACARRYARGIGIGERARVQYAVFTCLYRA